MMDKENPGLEVTILTIDHDLSEMDYKSLIRFVSDEKRRRIERYHFYKDAQNALISDILARFEICKRTGLSNWQLHISANRYGKPYLVNDPHIQYNLSHSGNYIALAIDSKAVGIDIEQIKPIDIKIAERFFSKDEILYITSHTRKMRTIAFYQIWTKKESYIKLEGKGLSIPLTSFSVLSQSSEKILYYNMRETADDAICHVCTSRMEEPHCYPITLSMFLNKLNIGDLRL